LQGSFPSAERCGLVWWAGRRRVESGIPCARWTLDKPPEEITPEIFAHLVHLAELELDPEEAEYLRGQLNGQLRAIREMAAIEVDPATPITSHGVPYPPEARPPLREDVVEPCDDVEAILAQAPETDARYLVVPDIPHTELES